MEGGGDQSPCGGAGGRVLGRSAACEGSTPPPAPRTAWWGPRAGFGRDGPCGSRSELPSPRTNPAEGIGRFRGSYRGPGRSHRPAVRFCPGHSEEGVPGAPARTRGARWGRAGSGVWVAGGVEGSRERAGCRGGGGSRAWSLQAALFTRTSFLSGPDANETRSNPLCAVCAASSERGFVNRGSGTSRPGHQRLLPGS